MTKLCVVGYEPGATACSFNMAKSNWDRIKQVWIKPSWPFQFHIFCSRSLTEVFSQDYGSPWQQANPTQLRQQPDTESCGIYCPQTCAFRCWCTRRRAHWRAAKEAEAVPPSTAEKQEAKSNDDITPHNHHNTPHHRRNHHFLVRLVATLGGTVLNSRRDHGLSPGLQLWLQQWLKQTYQA